MRYRFCFEGRIFWGGSRGGREKMVVDVLGRLGGKWLVVSDGILWEFR